MKNVFSTLGLAAALLAVACDSKEQCVADCDGQASSGSTSGSSSEGEAESGAGSLVCGQHEDDVTDFIEQNRDCQTVLDCVAVDGLCYEGDADNPCGSIGLSASADLDAWQAAYGELAGNCECPAGDPCGAALMCNEQQQCVASFGDEAYCPSIEEDVQTFLAANRACEVDDDCVLLTSTCVDGGCGGVAANVGVDVDGWNHLEELLLACDAGSDEFCAYQEGDCAEGVRCSDAGECVVERP